MGKRPKPIENKRKSRNLNDCGFSDVLVREGDLTCAAAQAASGCGAPPAPRQEPSGSRPPDKRKMTA